LPKILFKFSTGNECAFAALAVNNPEATERFQRLARGHAAYAKARGNLLLGRHRIAHFPVARANLLEQLLLDLVVERNNTLPVEGHGVHHPLQLSRRLDKF